MSGECFGHMNMKAWLRGPEDYRGYRRIICGGCRKFIGWERPKAKKPNKAEKASLEMYQCDQ